MATSSSFSKVAERGVPLAFQDVIRDPGDALTAAGLDYSIDDLPLSELTDAKFANRWHAAVRSSDGAIVGVNSSRFYHHQPHDLAILGDAIVQIRDDAYFSAGGESTDGRTQFLVVTLGEGIDTGGGQMYRNILLMNGTNGNAMLQGIAFNFRVVCMNQFPAIRRGGATLFKLGHTWSASQAMPTAIAALQDATRVWDDMDREIERLLSTPITSPGAVAETIAGHRPADKEEGQPNRALTEWEKRVEAIMDEYQADWNAEVRGTGWGMVMAAQGVDEHCSRVRGGNRELQRLTRVAEDRYPLMNRALAVV